MISNRKTGGEPDPVNKVMCGDTVSVMQRLRSSSVDLIVTDPPYLVDYQDRAGRSIAGDRDASWVYPAFYEMHRILKPNGLAVSFYGWNRIGDFERVWRQVGFTLVSHLVWVKDYASSKRGFTRYCHESAYLLAKGRPRKPRAPIPDVLEWEYTGNKHHPIEKPVRAILPLIRSFSEIGDVVCDPFAGSGTTLVAAKLLKRRWLGIELEAKYCAIAERRLSGVQRAE